MSDDDLIRRGDVYRLLQSGAGLTLNGHARRVAALPAVTPAPTLAEALELPEIKALVEASAADAREVYAGSCDNTQHAIDYMEQVMLAALRRIAEGQA